MKKTINVDVWDCNVLFFTSPKTCIKHTGVSEESLGSGLCTFSDGRDVFILIDADIMGEVSPIAVLRVVSHEACHASLHIMKNIASTDVVENQEPLCYTQDYIMAECVKFLQKNYDFKI